MYITGSQQLLKHSFHNKLFSLKHRESSKQDKAPLLLLLPHRVYKYRLGSSDRKISLPKRKSEFFTGDFIVIFWKLSHPIFKFFIIIIMPGGMRQTAQMVNGRWWFLKNSSGVNTGQPVNGRWWFLRNNSTSSSQSFSSSENTSRKFIDPSRNTFGNKPF